MLERGKRFLLSTQRKDGLIQSPQPRGPMYEHALATLALAEMYGQDPDPQLENGLRRAVTLIVNAQSGGGGWRYQPKPGDQDLSVSVMQIVALRAANNADVPVPEETIRKAIAFVRSCTVAAGGFSYQPGGGLSPQMAAAGTLSLQLLGQYDDDRIGPAVDAVTRMPVVWGQSHIQYFFYFHYYAIQASYQAGGRNWNLWHPRVREMMLASQQADGRWTLPPGYSNEPGEIYPTAMAALILEIYMHYLPAYQR
ncbi:MAG: prenyltransferase/squalene oxidase repeat-containing protein [Kiritimatiellia bacterium]